RRDRVVAVERRQDDASRNKGATRAAQSRAKGEFKDRRAAVIEGGNKANRARAGAAARIAAEGRKERSAQCAHAQRAEKAGEGRRAQEAGACRNPQDLCDHLSPRRQPGSQSPRRAFHRHLELTITGYARREIPSPADKALPN